MIHIGFTGTRRPLIEAQHRVLYQAFVVLLDGATLHHGDCVGADAYAHDLADSLGLQIEIHPPLNPKSRAWKTSSIIHPPKEYLVRNKDIVNASGRLIACPRDMTEDFRGSGTWHAIRYAKKQRKPTLIIYPNGRTLNY